jgi:hypothetical protein
MTLAFMGLGPTELILAGIIFIALPLLGVRIVVRVTRATRRTFLRFVGSVAFVVVLGYHFSTLPHTPTDLSLPGIVLIVVKALMGISIVLCSALALDALGRSAEEEAGAEPAARHRRPAPIHE